MNPKTEFTDTERLEWLIKTSSYVVDDIPEYFRVDNRFGILSRRYKSPRAAIDDAMRRERG